jgi:HD superfamily phosphohydrolase
MPAWGLTEEQRKIESGMGPWGLHPRLLAPAKVTTDPVHGDIYTTWLEQAIVDSPPFQRLRRIRQLGTTHLVYPGATHTRFSHSLGTLRVAQDLLDAVLTQHEGRHPVPDLVMQWREGERPLHIARSIVLARLGALLHDLGHVPFGHSIEDDLKVLVEHDANEDRFTNLWGHLAAFVRGRVQGEKDFDDEQEAILETLGTLLDEGDELHAELRPMVISKGGKTKKRGELTYPFAADLVGNTICADLLDYLLRDHLYTGLPVALGRRFMSAFFIVPEGRGEFEKRLALNIMRERHERTDVVTELLKALRYRYELSERALVHHAKLSADAMLGKVLELWSDALWLWAACGRIMGFDDAETLRRDGDVESMRQRFHEEFEPEYEEETIGDEERKIHPVDRVVRRELEGELIARGDDGLLEELRTFTRLRSSDPRVQAAGGFEPLVLELHKHAGELADAFLERRLFKLSGRVGVQDAPAQELYEEFGKDARKRSTVERDAERFAGLRGVPQVLIWLPNPKMRVKVAEVLVDDGDHIDRFAAYEEPRARRGSEIYGGHSRLWGLWVFTHPDMPSERREDVLAYLAERFGVAWEKQREHWGNDYWQWVDQLILSRVLDTDPQGKDVRDLVLQVTAATPARGHADTCADRRRRLARLKVVKQAQERRARAAGDQ